MQGIVLSKADSSLLTIIYHLLYSGFLELKINSILTKMEAQMNMANIMGQHGVMDLLEKQKAIDRLKAEIAQTREDFEKKLSKYQGEFSPQ